MKLKDIMKKFNHRPNMPTSTKAGFDTLKQADKENYLIKKGDANKIAADIKIAIDTLYDCGQHVPQGLKQQITNRIERLIDSKDILNNLK